MLLNDKLINNIIQEEVEVSNLEMETEQVNILVVEGKSDREMLEKIAQMLNLTFDFQIVEMKGVSNFKKIYDAFEWQHKLNVKYLTDNDYSARRCILKEAINPDDVLTSKIYAHVRSSIRELEEYITNMAHHKHKPTKKKLIKRIWEWKNISNRNVNHLISTIRNAFA